MTNQKKKTFTIKVAKEIVTNIITVAKPFLTKHKSKVYASFYIGTLLLGTQVQWQCNDGHLNCEGKYKPKLDSKQIQNQIEKGIAR